MKVSVMCKKRVSDSAVFTYPVNFSAPTLERAKKELVEFHQFWKCNTGCLPSFEAQFGFAIEQCVDPNSEHYILPDIVNCFKASHDWGIAIVNAMEKRAKKNEEPIHVTCLVDWIAQHHSYDDATLRLMHKCVAVAVRCSDDDKELHDALKFYFQDHIDPRVIDRVTMHSDYFRKPGKTETPEAQNECACSTIPVSKLVDYIQHTCGFDAATMALIRNCVDSACEDSIDTTDLQERLSVLLHGLVGPDLISRVTFTEA